MGTISSKVIEEIARYIKWNKEDRGIHH